MKNLPSIKKLNKIAKKFRIKQIQCWKKDITEMRLALTLARILK